MTIEKEFCDKLYWPNVFGTYNSKNKAFHVSIDNVNNIEMNAFDPREPEIKYV